MNNPKRAYANRMDDGEAFLPDFTSRGEPTNAADAEFFAEQFLASATTGEDMNETAADEVVEEEVGGPFLEDGLDVDDAAETVRIPEPPVSEVKRSSR